MFWCIPSSIACQEDLELTPLSEPERSWIHWRSLRLGLVHDIVERFPTELSCHERVAAVRWPAGVKCGRCGSGAPTLLKTRLLFQCRTCRHQFSVKSDTVMEGSRMKLQTWFSATHALIQYRDRMGPFGHMPAHDLSDRLRLHYPAAYRLKKLILKDIDPEGPGILSASVCENVPGLPTDIVPNSRPHLDWLLSQET